MVPFTPETFIEYLALYAPATYDDGYYYYYDDYDDDDDGSVDPVSSMCLSSTGLSIDGHPVPYGFEGDVTIGQMVSYA